MKTVVKSYAKINLSLNVYGLNNGYHDLDTVVVSVGLADTIKLKKRKDKEIKIKMKGYDIPLKENNAYKAAKLFEDEFATNGADIEIIKKIPIGGGLGGSSADSSGVLRAMAKAYGISSDLKPLADKLGSDTAYQLSGGFARLKGRGTDIEILKDPPSFYVVLALVGGGVNTKECYALFDRLNRAELADNDKLIEDIFAASFGEAAKNCINGLYYPAAELNSEINRSYEKIKKTCPCMSGMTGSGSTLFAVYGSRKEAYSAAKKLKGDGLNVVVTKTIKLYN